METGASRGEKREKGNIFFTFLKPFNKVVWVAHPQHIVSMFHLTHKKFCYIVFVIEIFIQCLKRLIIIW